MLMERVFKDVRIGEGVGSSKDVIVKVGNREYTVGLFILVSNGMVQECNTIVNRVESVSTVK
jgi:hypothetical protein